MYNNVTSLKIYQDIVPPTHCPACGGELELVNAQLFCRNSACSAQSVKRFEHFAKTMKIKGLGPKTIEKLIDKEVIQEIYDLFYLDIESISPIVGEKIAIKLIQEIDASRTTTIGTFISAFSIPLIGNTAGKKLETTLSSLQDILSADFETLKQAGLGDKAASNLLDWISDYFSVTAPAFEEKIIITDNTKIKASINKPNVGTVVITGKFDKSRSVLQLELEELGFEVKTTVTSKTNYLLCADSDSASSKVQKAKSLGVKIVTNIDELKAFAEI